MLEFLQYSDPDNGAEYQIITSTGFPLLLAFMIDYIYRLLDKKEKR